MARSVCGVLVVLVLFCGVLTTGAQCDLESEVSCNSSLSVNATLTSTDDNITLKCSTVNGNVASNQYFKWTEGGQEIISSQMITIEYTNSQSILTIHNATFHHYGEYTCQCHNNFTAEDIQSIIADEKSFYLNCSQPTSMLVSPPGNNTDVIYHEVDMPDTIVEVMCTGDLKLIRVTGNQGEVPSPRSVSIFAPSDQEKFLCVDESNNIKEIQYISIKDYEPLQFLLPTRPNENVHVTYDPASLTRGDFDIPVCAVYSSIELYGLTTVAGEMGTLDDNNDQINDLYIKLIGNKLINGTYSCTAETIWETSQINYIITFVQSMGSEQPNDILCVTASIDPPIHNIASGSDLTFYCLISSNGVFSDITINITHDSKNGDERMLEPILDIETGTTQRYYVLLSEVSKEDEGVYTCHVSLNSLQREDSLTISVIPGPETEKDISSTHTQLLASSYTTLNSPSSSYNLLNSPSSSYNLLNNPSSSYTILNSPSSSYTILNGPSSSHNLLNSPSSPYNLLNSPSSSSTLSTVLNSLSTSATSISSVFPSMSVEPIIKGGSNGLVNVIFATISVFMVLVSIAVCLLLFTICLRKRQKRRIEAENKLSLEETCSVDDNDRLSPLLKSEEDGLSLSISLRSFTSLMRELHPSNQMMKKCIQELFLSTLYIPYNKLEFYEDLGAGAFGKVKRAQVYGINGSSIVAVKMLKDFPTEEEERDLITEFKVLQCVGNHENIVNLIGGTIYNSGPDNCGQLLVVVEYCSGGNLLHYLRKKRGDTVNPLSVPHQLNMGSQVACGMEYLSSKKCVHRDLAARNILLTANGTLKVADFGLARETYHSVYTKTTKGKIPFKWMAPESIFDKVYTTRSDVWSFGVLLWEIFTLGQSPYPGKTVDEMMKDLQAQKLMERPPTCPVNVFDIILHCWRFDPKDRPNFNMLVHILESVLISDECCGPNYYNIPDNCLCVGHSDSIEDSGHNGCITPSDLDLSSQEEEPKYIEMLSSIASTNPALAVNIKNLCTDCKQSYLYYSYNNYVYPESPIVRKEERLSEDYIKTIDLCSSCKLNFHENLERSQTYDENDVFDSPNTHNVKQTPTARININSVRTESSDSGMIQDLNSIEMEHK